MEARTKTTIIKLKIYYNGSVAHFNVCNLATLLIYDAVGSDKEFNELWIGVSMIINIEYNKSCWQIGEYMITRRRMLRGLKKSKTVETTNKEGKVHGSGMSSWKCKYRRANFEFGGNC